MKKIKLYYKYLLPFCLMAFTGSVYASNLNYDSKNHILLEIINDKNILDYGLNVENFNNNQTFIITHKDNISFTYSENKKDINDGLYIGRDFDYTTYEANLEYRFDNGISLDFDYEENNDSDLDYMGFLISYTYKFK